MTKSREQNVEMLPGILVTWSTLSLGRRRGRIWSEILWIWSEIGEMTNNWEVAKQGILSELGVWEKFTSSSLILCLTACPWQPCPPFISTFCPSFHFCVTSFFQLSNHAHPWPPGFLLTILPSITSFNKLCPRTTCPTQFFFRFTISCTKHLSSPTFT